MTEGDIQRELSKLGIDMREFIRLVAREVAQETARTILQDHAQSCPLTALSSSVQELQTRVAAIELSKAKLVGFMAGAGAFGGVSAEVLSRLIGG